MLGFSPRLNLSKTFAYEECWKEGRGFLRGKTNARYFSRGNNSMAKVFYRWNLKLSLRCELTKKFQIPVVSLRFFLSISPFQLCTILWNNVPRIFLSLVVRETTSRYRFRLRFDPTPLCFPCKILPRISYPGLYQSLLLSFLFFYPNLPHDLTYTFPSKILGDRDDTFRFPLFLIQVYIEADFGSSFYRTLWRMPEEMTEQVVVNS